MTITFSLWQGSRLLSTGNIATEMKQVDTLIQSLNDSDQGKKVKFEALVQEIKVGK